MLGLIPVDSAGAAVRTWTAYDGDNAYADFNGSAALQVRYLHGPAVDELLARTSAAGTTAWYLTDRLGSVRDVASTAGAVIDHVAYDSYGKVTSETSPSNGDRFKFTGRELDAGTGLQYNRARYYDAAIGRWTQEDPIGFEAGDANLYRYVGNGPTNRIDPSGLDWLDYYSSWAPDFGFGEKIIYPIVSKIIGNDNLANASSGQLLVGTGVVATAAVATCYAGWIVYAANGSRIIIYGENTTWLIRGGRFPGFHTSFETSSKLGSFYGEFNGPWGRMPFRLLDEISKDAIPLLRIPVRNPNAALQSGSKSYTCVTGAINSIIKEL